MLVIYSWDQIFLCYYSLLGSVQFISVTQSCPSLWYPHCSTSFFVHHQFLELAQAHVHQVGDAIQPSRPLLSPSPPAFYISQHQSLFQSALHISCPKYQTKGMSQTCSDQSGSSHSLCLWWFRSNHVTHFYPISHKRKCVEHWENFYLINLKKKEEEGSRENSPWSTTSVFLHQHIIFSI